MGSEGLSLPTASRTLCRISGLWAKASVKRCFDGIIGAAAMQAAVFGSESQELGARVARHWGPIGKLAADPCRTPAAFETGKAAGLQPQLFLSHTPIQLTDLLRKCK